MEKKRTKKFLTAIALLLCLFCVAYGTWAYFTAEEHVTNVITTGKIDITLIESGDVKWPAEKLTGVMPGQTIAKKVEVENVDGAADAWVRVKVDKMIDVEDADLSLIELDINTDSWLDGQDGYYYYKEPLKSGKKTEPLFSTVNISKNMDNRYQGCSTSIEVSAQAVQVKNNDLNAGGAQVAKLETTADIAAIQGWPKAKGGEK